MSAIVALHAMVAFIGFLVLLVSFVEERPSKRTALFGLGLTMIVCSLASFFMFLSLLKR